MSQNQLYKILVGDKDDRMMLNQYWNKDADEIVNYVHEHCSNWTTIYISKKNDYDNQGVQNET